MNYPGLRRNADFSKVAIGACVVLILAIVAGAWKVFLNPSNVTNGLSSLRSAYSEHRPLEARISSLSYAPFSATRAAGPVPHNAAELRMAELTLIEAKVEKPTAEVQHALGQVYLSQKRFDDAVREFDAALKSDPNNSTLLSDIGAAWLEKAKVNLDRGANDQH